MKSEVRDMGLFGLWWFWVLVLLLAASVVVFAVRPAFLSLEAQQNRASQQYTETVESNLYKMAADYEQLGSEANALSATTNPNQSVIDGKRAQQQAILSRMSLECSKLRPESRPSALGKYGC